MDGRKREKTPDLNKKKTKAVKQEKRAVFPVHTPLPLRRRPEMAYVEVDGVKWVRGWEEMRMKTKEIGSADVAGGPRRRA